MKKPKRILIYDIETYLNYFLIRFIDYTTGKKYEVELSETINTLEMLKDILTKDFVLIGYNNFAYDDRLLKFIIFNGYKVSNRDLYDLSRALIEKETPTRFRYKFFEFMKKIKGRKLFDSIDLIKITGNKISLKELAIGLNWENIQELPFDPHKPVTDAQIQILKRYCLNDVLVTQQLYEHNLEAIELREYLDEEYKEAKKAVGFTHSFVGMTEAEIAENLMGVLYCYEK